MIYAVGILVILLSSLGYYTTSVVKDLGQAELLSESYLTSLNEVKDRVKTNQNLARSREKDRRKQESILQWRIKEYETKLSNKTKEYLNTNVPDDLTAIMLPDLAVIKADSDGSSYSVLRTDSASRITIRFKYITELVEKYRSRLDSCNLDKTTVLSSINAYNNSIKSGEKSD